MNIERLTAQIVQAFSSAVEAKDSYTNGHSLRVADYSVKIAMGIDASIVEQRILYAAGLLHDIGKIGIPDSILTKPGKLTDEEFAVIKTHPVIGADILDTITELPELSLGARYHHERYDGKGYPEGIKGEQIPWMARVIAVADAYDAMTSNRSYRPLMPQEKVRGEIQNGRGTQFDPVYADVMLSIIDKDTHYDLHG